MWQYMWYESGPINEPNLAGLTYSGAVFHPVQHMLEALLCLWEDSRREIEGMLIG